MREPRRRAPCRDRPRRVRPRDWRFLKIAATFLGALVAVVLLRSPIMAALPGGLPDEVAMLEFQSVRSETVHLKGTSTLFVEGEIVNRSGQRRRSAGDPHHAPLAGRRSGLLVAGGAGGGGSCPRPLNRLS